MADAELPPDAIVITALGMESSLGGVVTACAAARAGLSMARELPDYSITSRDGTEIEIHGHSVATVSGFRGLGRLVALGWSALSELLRDANLDGTNLAHVGFSVGLADYSSRAPRGAGKDD